MRLCYTDDEEMGLVCELSERAESARQTRDHVSSVVQPHIQVRVSIEELEFLLRRVVLGD